MLERDVVKKVRDHAKARGWEMFKYHGSPFSHKNFPDTFGFTEKGLFYAIEIKAPGEEPNEGQLAFQQYLREKGVISFWCDSVKSFERKLLDFPQAYS